MLKDNIENLATDKFDDHEAARKNIPINKKQIIKMNIKYNTDNINKKLCTKFKLIKNDQEIIFKLSGQKCRTLIALIKNKNKGITALEVSSWSFRLAAYVHILRSKFNLNIITIKEAHKWGFHARYHILDKVEILEGALND